MSDLLWSTKIFMQEAGQLKGVPLMQAQASPQSMTVEGAAHWDKIWELRQELIREEHNEYIDAVAQFDIVEICDGLLDKIVVEWGTLLALVGAGIAEELAGEVAQSNLNKVIGDGLPMFREDGKVIKPEGWSPPDIEGVLRKHGLISG